MKWYESRLYDVEDAVMSSTKTVLWVRKRVVIWLSVVTRAGKSVHGNGGGYLVFWVNSTCCWSFPVFVHTLHASCLVLPLAAHLSIHNAYRLEGRDHCYLTAPSHVGLICFLSAGPRYYTFCLEVINPLLCYNYVLCNLDLSSYGGISTKPCGRIAGFFIEPQNKCMALHGKNIAIVIWQCVLSNIAGGAQNNSDSRRWVACMQLKWS